jgi:hypothetical protein
MSEAKHLNKTRIIYFHSKDPKRIAAYKKKIESQVERAVSSKILNPETWAGSWGRTIRRNGDIVEGAFRNIYDEGNLWASLDFVWRGMTLVVTSDSPYIEAVLTGHEYITKSGSIAKVEGRNFLNLDNVKIG